MDLGRKSITRSCGVIKLENKSWYQSAKKKFFKYRMNYVIPLAIFFLLITFSINPVNAGYGVNDGLRATNINDFNNLHCGVYMDVTANYTIPESDGFGGIVYTTQIKHFKIPLVAEPVTNNMFPEGDSVGTPNLFNTMEKLQTDPNDFLGDLMSISNIVPDIQNTYFLDTYQNYTELTPLTQRPEVLYNSWQHETRYQAIVPSPAQFAYMIAQSNGWILNNVTSAYTQTITGTGGIRPSYIIESYGQECAIDNNTADMVINLELANESDYGSNIPFATQNDYNSYTAYIYDEEGDSWANPLFLGSFYITGFVPHAYTTVQEMDSEGEKGLYGNFRAMQKLTSSIAERENITYAPSESDGVNAQFLALDIFGWLGQVYGQAQLTEQLLMITGFLIGNQVGSKNGYDDGVDDTLTIVEPWLDLAILEWSDTANISDQDLQTLRDTISRTLGSVKGNITNPYDKAGAGLPVTTGFGMPISLTIVVIVIITIVIIGVIILFVYVFVVRKRKKATEQKTPGGSKVKIESL